ncbi:MAG: SPASM domain-containing protein, partial [bacterium]
VVQISLHASNSQLHKLLTKTDSFDRIVKQIEYLVSMRERKDRPTIDLVFLVNTLNIENLPDFVEFAACLGADKVTCNYMTIYAQSHLKLSCFFKQEITNLMFQRAREVAEKSRIILNLPPKFGMEENSDRQPICSEPWKYFYVEAEGSVLPCCYAGEHIGYLHKEDFEAIWNGNLYKELRRSLVENDLQSYCKHCYKNNSLNVNDLRAHISFCPEIKEKILKEES